MVTTDRSKGQLPLIVDTEMLLTGHHPGFSPEGRGSQMGSVLRRNLRAQSHDRMLAGSTRGRAMNNEGKRLFIYQECLSQNQIKPHQYKPILHSLIQSNIYFRSWIK